MRENTDFIRTTHVQYPQPVQWWVTARSVREHDAPKLGAGLLPNWERVCCPWVRVISRSTLQAFWKKHPDAEQPLKAWFAEVEKASWSGPADVRKRYGSADFVGSDRIIFNIRGNNYRLIVMVKYAPIYCVYVRFIGTHKEYDNVDAATV